MNFRLLFTVFNSTFSYYIRTCYYTRNQDLLWYSRLQPTYTVRRSFKTTPIQFSLGFFSSCLTSRSHDVNRRRMIPWFRRFSQWTRRGRSVITLNSLYFLKQDLSFFLDYIGCDQGFSEETAQVSHLDTKLKSLISFAQKLIFRWFFVITTQPHPRL